MEDIEVTLSPAELAEADQYAARANSEAAARNAQESLPGVSRNPRAASTLGFRAQRAFCKYLGTPWQPRDARKGANIGSLYKARGRQRYAGNPRPGLLVKSYERFDLVFVHITTEDSVTFSVHGWMRGAEAKTFAKTNHGYEAHEVPIDALHPPAELPSDPALNPHQACDLKVA